MLSRITDILFFAACQQFLFKSKTEDIFLSGIGWCIGICIAQLILSYIKKDEEKKEE